VITANVVRNEQLFLEWKDGKHFGEYRTMLWDVNAYLTARFHNPGDVHHRENFKPQIILSLHGT
jgi:hypothetical protein